MTTVTGNRQLTTDWPLAAFYAKLPVTISGGSFGRSTGAHPNPCSEPDHLSKATILGMIAMGVAVLVVANNFTALSVALPAIEDDLHTKVATVQWGINGYAMVFGVLIVTGGRLADMFGRRRIFFAGATIFAGFSLIGGFAPTPPYCSPAAS